MCATTMLQDDKTQKLKSWFLNTTRVLLVQRQIFINKIQIWQEELNLQQFLIVPLTIYYIRNSLPYVSIFNVSLYFL